MSRDVILVGTKPVMNYVMAIITALGTEKIVYVKARGKAIVTAVDAVEIVRKRFLPGTVLDGIEIDTESVESFDSSPRNVSTIAIALSKS